MSIRHSQQGFTLIELIITIVVLSAGLSGILLVYTNTVLRSADPLLQQQALAIAEGYMEEIQGKICHPGTESTGNPPRGAWQFADDFNSLEQPPTQIDGTALSQLSDYSVRVSVTAEAFGPAGQQVNGCGVSVQVSNQRVGNINVSLTAFMAPWPDEALP
ncbi:type IV pilus modification PilV family protein [Nitrincola sp.]|uniref:type IV pilus modification PilV family protein n=1 Tax=Nitrincola sp. TaxID=1926584 RepID=UPI003A8EF621